MGGGLRERPREAAGLVRPHVPGGPHGIAELRIRRPWPATPTNPTFARSGISASLPISTPARPRPPSASFITPGKSTGWVTWTRGTRRPTTWKRNASGASPSSPRRSPAAGRTSADSRSRSTSSTPRATSISPPRSSGRCACSTAQWSSSRPSRASRPRARRSGARPPSIRSRGSASSTRWTVSALNTNVSTRKLKNGSSKAIRSRSRSPSVQDQRGRWASFRG